MSGGMRIGFELLPQACNADPQNFLVRFIFRAPNTGQKIFGGEDLADVMGELQEQAIFGGGKRNRLVIAPNFGAGKIDSKILVREETRATVLYRRLGASQHRAYARQ